MSTSWNNLRALLHPGVLLLIPLLWLSGCGEDTPREQQLRDTMDIMEQAARERSVSDLMEHVSDDYQDEQGRTWDDVRRIAALEFLRNRSVHVLKAVSDLRLSDEDNASAVVLVALAGEPIESVDNLANMRADLMRFDVEFRYDETWKVRSARWQRATLADFLP